MAQVNPKAGFQRTDVNAAPNAASNTPGDAAPPPGDPGSPAGTPAGTPAGDANQTASDAFVVNGGQLLLRWTNDRFLATPHRAINRSGGERYALAFFCDAQIDWPIAAVPTTVGPDKPPKYETTFYTDYTVAYQKRTYDLLQQAAE